MFTCFVPDSNCFYNIRDWIYASERLEFKIDLINLKLPRSNEIYGHSFPREQPCRAWGKVAIVPVTLFVELAFLGTSVDHCDAGPLEVISVESCTDSVVQSLLSTMAQNQVIPSQQLCQECQENDYFPDNFSVWIS